MFSRHLAFVSLRCGVSMRIIILHGFNATPSDHFYPSLASDMRALGYDVVVPTLSLVTGEAFSLPTIIDELKKQVGFIKKDDILVGHSLSSFIILQYLEAVEMTETPRAVVLVAPPWSVSRPELRPLFIVDLDADVLMWKAREFVVIHSKDDTLVPVVHGKHLARALKARWIETENDGHFMDTKYPALSEQIDKIINTPFLYAPGSSLEDDYKVGE